MTKTFYYTIYSGYFNVVLKQKLCIVCNIKLDLMVDHGINSYSIVIIYNKDVHFNIKKN